MNVEPRRNKDKLDDHTNVHTTATIPRKLWRKKLEMTRDLHQEFRNAVHSDDCGAIEELLKKDSTLAAKCLDPNGDDSPVFQATDQGNFDLVKLLLEHGADLDKPAQRGTGGAIHLAVERGHYAIANLLYDHGAAVDSTPDACLPTVDELYIAAMKAGASPDLVRFGCEDLLGPANAEAPADDAPEVVKLFHRVLTLGGKPMFCTIVRHEHFELLRELLTKCGTQPAARNDSPPGTVFFNITGAASWLGYPDILELCRETCPELYDAPTARLAVCRAIGSHNRDGCHPEYRRLIENQIKFMKQRGELNVELMSPLHWIADQLIQSRTYGFKCQELPTAADVLDLAELLLEYGFDVNFRSTETNMTPLAVAAGGGPIEYVEFLIDHGADLCADDPDETNPLAIAKRKRRDEILKLLEAGRSAS